MQKARHCDSLVRRIICQRIAKPEFIHNNMEDFKSYDYLPQEAINIRKAVFMEEQGFSDEFDEIDESAIHVVMYDGENPVATCRIYYSESHKCYSIGRIAVAKAYRACHYGAKMLSFAEKEIIGLKQHRGGTSAVIGLSAQKQAVGFYEKQGYRPVGFFYLDENCPHLWMEKAIGNNG